MYGRRLSKKDRSGFRSGVACTTAGGGIGVLMYSINAESISRLRFFAVLGQYRCVLLVEDAGSDVVCCARLVSSGSSNSLKSSL